MPSEPVKCFGFLYPGTSVMGIDDDERNAIDNADGGTLTPMIALVATDYAAMQSRITRLEEALTKISGYESECSCAFNLGCSCDRDACQAIARTALRKDAATQEDRT